MSGTCLTCLGLRSIVRVISQEMAQPAAANEPLISACLIVRNEEANLPRCLAGLQGLVDEVVAVDTGSTDNTVEILRDSGAVIRKEVWANSFALHRNQSLELASGTWVLVIDADEEILNTDASETRSRLWRDGLPDMLLASMELMYPEGRVTRTVAPRLFRRSRQFRFVHAVHEQLDVADEPAALSNISIRHHGYRDITLVREKERRNLALAELMPRTSHAMHCVARAAFTLGDWERVIRCADELNSAAGPAVLRVECNALAAAASLNLNRLRELERFAALVAELAPDSPDGRFLAVLVGLHRYLEVLGTGDSLTASVALRPPIFPHTRELALRTLHVLHAGLHRNRALDIPLMPTRGAS